MNKYILLILVVNICASNIWCQRKSTVQVLQIESDVQYHFKIMDSAANATKNDTVHCCHDSIRFMETKTKIYSTARITYFGPISFTKSDLINWHNWYKKKLRNSKQWMGSNRLCNIDCCRWILSHRI